MEARLSRVQPPGSGSPDISYGIGLTDTPDYSSSNNIIGERWIWSGNTILHLLNNNNFIWTSPEPDNLSPIVIGISKSGSTYDIYQDGEFKATTDNNQEINYLHYHSIACFAATEHILYWLIVRQFAATEPTVTILNSTTTYTYDSYNKLTGISYTDGSSETLTYDDNGNLTSRIKTLSESEGGGNQNNLIRME